MINFFERNASGIETEEENNSRDSKDYRYYSRMDPPPNLVVVSSEEDIRRRDEECLKDVYCFQNGLNIFEDEGSNWMFSQNRSLFDSQIKLKTKLCKYLWNLRSVSVSSALLLFNELREMIKIALKKVKVKRKLTSEVLILNNCFTYLNYLDQLQKRQFIHLFAKLLSYPNNITWISAENQFLFESDGLRLLLILCLYTGKTLEYFHIWNFLRDPGYSSLTERSQIPDFFRFQQTYREKSVWKSLLCPLYLNDLPKDLYYFAYYVSLSALENLTALSVKYSMLAVGEGESLCHLECIKRGSLRVLNLLCTAADSPHITNLNISNASWSKAMEFCPLLKVNIVSVQIIRFDELKLFLKKKMPLEGFHISCTGMPIDTKGECTGWLLCQTMNLISSHYRKIIKRFGFNILNPPVGIDLAVTKLISSCPYLEEFEYTGRFYCIETIKDICEFYASRCTRLRKLSLNIREDPCKPGSYKQPLQKFFNEYEGDFIDKGIEFILDTYKI